MASQTEAEAAAMAQTAQKFRATNAELQGQLQRLTNELDTLQTAWRGRGARAFDNARLAWDANMKKLHQALDETANAIEKAGTFYTASDEASASRLDATQSSPIRLPL